MFTHLKLWIASAIPNFKWVKIQIEENDHFIMFMADGTGNVYDEHGEGWLHLLKLVTDGDSIVISPQWGLTQC